MGDCRMAAKDVSGVATIRLFLYFFAAISLGARFAHGFETSEIRALEAQSQEMHEPKRSPLYQRPSSLYPFGKRTQLVGAPLIRFGKRDPSGGGAVAMAPRALRTTLDQPLIRFGKRAAARFGGGEKAPLIRFGKRTALLDANDGEQQHWVATSMLRDGEEGATGGGMHGYYARFHRNPRPNPVDEEDTMLRFG